MSAEDTIPQKSAVLLGSGSNAARPTSVSVGRLEADLATLAEAPSKEVVLALIRQLTVASTQLDRMRDANTSLRKCSVILAQQVSRANQHSDELRKENRKMREFIARVSGAVDRRRRRVSERPGHRRLEPTERARSPMLGPS